MRLRHYGSGASIRVIAVNVGISEGGVSEWTDRVIEALVALSPEWMCWPDERERAIHSKWMRKEGFPAVWVLWMELPFRLLKNRLKKELLILIEKKGTL